MHTFSETGTGVPAFLAKLWRLVDDPDTNNLICWTKDGRSFIIQNQAQFARELLPLNYKHNNMASFIRQLNMYGFHKITSIENGGLKFDKDEMEFSHPCFKRNCAYLLEHIKRKIANTKNVNEDKSAIKPEAVTKVLQDVKAMRGRQDSLDSRFSVMKQENEALWREIASLRQKHAKQQQIVNKLIQFLITIVQPSRNMSGVKRHMQLMIEPDNVKERKISESNSETGPVIHELGEDLLDEVEDSENELIDRNSPYIKSLNDFQENDSASPLNAGRPQSTLSNLSQSYDYSNQSADDVYNVPVVSGNIDGSGSVIESVNPDGSQVIYHVTELPDLNPPEIHDAIVNDENVLNTPMVREQIARSQVLKQKNKQRRKQNITKEGMLPSTSAKSIKLQHNNQLAQKQQQKPQLKLAIPSTEVKTELNIDPIEFLNAYPENQILTTKAPLTSSNTTEKAHESTAVNAGISGKPSDLYIPNDFISNEMPANIFEDSLNSGADFSNEQKQYVVPTVSGKFSSFLAGNNSANGASTSAAAAAAALNSSGTQQSQAQNVNNNESSQDKNDTNMAVAKYKNGKSGNDDFMRLSTADEVHGHLENVQDELDTLRDLLRSDSYSLDANTLMGLFNDADIMNSYGLSLNMDPTNDNKKGSELMTYQPFYDFSDIMDMNDKDEINATDDAANPPSSSSSRQPQRQDSVLNTPHHE